MTRTVVRVEHDRRAQIRHAFRNHCVATTVHGDHHHDCDGTGDHQILHTAYCDGRVLLWPGTAEHECGQVECAWRGES